MVHSNLSFRQVALVPQLLSFLKAREKNVHVYFQPIRFAYKKFCILKRQARCIIYYIQKIYLFDFCLPILVIKICIIVHKKGIVCFNSSLYSGEKE